MDEISAKIDSGETKTSSSDEVFDRLLNMPPLKWYEKLYYKCRRGFDRITDIPYDIKHFIQRGKRGYSDRDLWCYSEDTQVLTNNGWKFFYELIPTDTIATINTVTDTIEYQNYYHYFEAYFEGKMVHLQHNQYDLLVTLDHNHYLGGGKFKKAKDIKKYGKTKVTDYNWIGTEELNFYLPVEVETSKAVENTLTKLVATMEFSRVGIKRVATHLRKEEVSNKHIGKFPQIAINMDDWLAFFGIYIAEGWCNLHKITIRQYKTSRSYADIEKLLNKLPFKFNSYDKGFDIHNTQLAQYLHQFGKSHDKYFPKEFKALSKRQLNILLTWYLMGNGTLKNGEYVKATSVSTRLRDDIQELWFKLGYEGVIKGNYVYKRTDKYRWFEIMNIKQIDYKGKVYCVSVPNKTLYVRRNFQPAVSGNSFDWYLADVIEGGTKQLAKVSHGYPSNVESLEAWEVLLTRMAKAFEDYKTFEDRMYTFKEGTREFTYTQEEQEAEYNRIKKEMQLAIKYFGNLWD